MTLHALVDRVGPFRRPEYTGENRCLPCTAVNLCLTALIAVLVALVSPAGALAIVAVALASIYFRGYLIPGTPELTKRYVPKRILQVFEKSPLPVAASDIDPATVLIAAGVLIDEPNTPDTSVDPEFAVIWEERAAELLHGTESMARPVFARLTSVPEDDLDVVTYEDAVVVFLGEERLGTWESAAAFCVDVAGMELLSGYVHDWERLGMDARSEVAGALRLFVERCPDCGGEVALNELTIQSCCSSRDVVAVTCANCEVSVLELDVGTD